MTPSSDTSPLLNDDGIKITQDIVGALLYNGCTVENNILVGLSSLGSHKSASAKLTNASANQLFDYFATYPSNGIT